MRPSRIPTLDDLAFIGRNKDYGAYYLRRRYPRILLRSVILGLIILASLLSGSWLYYFMEPVPLIEGDLMYEVEYYSMNPPPDDELSKLAQALTRPPATPEQVPVVSDSVPVEEKKPVEKPVEKQDDKAREDSVAQPGGSGLGTGTGDDTGLATTMDVRPRYPGGDESRLYYLRQHIRYPEAALKGFIQGVVMVTFIVETDGSLSNVEVTRKIGGGCDEEAVRVTKAMPRWEPGKRNGRPVRVIVRMPIVFKIPGRPS